VLAMTVPERRDHVARLIAQLDAEAKAYEDL
jgi:hypothetical protein